MEAGDTSNVRPERDGLRYDNETGLRWYYYRHCRKCFGSGRVCAGKCSKQHEVLKI
jgi:hypothetical protein